MMDMDSQLKNLKEKMDKTVLKQGTISAAEKRRILDAAKNGRLKVKRHRNFLVPLLSVIVTAGLFFSIGSIFSRNLDETKEEGAATQDKIALQEGSKNEIFMEKPTKENERAELNAEQDTMIMSQPETAYFSYIVFNGYYYKKTGEEVPVEQLGEQIGEVKRTGDWEIKKSGDSNEIPPGSIYIIKNRSDEFIAAKGVVYKDGQNEDGYVVFQKAEPVAEGDPNEIEKAEDNLDKGKLR